jgi:hypothetical protein
MKGQDSPHPNLGMKIHPRVGRDVVALPQTGGVEQIHRKVRKEKNSHSPPILNTFEFKSERLFKPSVNRLSAIFAARFLVNCVFVNDVTVSQNNRLTALRTVCRLSRRIVNVAGIDISQTGR